MIENVGGRVRAGKVLLRCALAYGVSLDSFEFSGFPEGTTFAWTGTELKVLDCPQGGVVIIVR